MQFYPHNVSAGLVGTTLSSSLAVSASLINNFAAIPVHTVSTASIGLNISGANGVDGTSIASYGPKGENGERGVQGFRGNSIFLLSSAWSGSACGGTPPTCFGPFTLYAIGPNIEECRTDQGSSVVYSNGSSVAINNNIVGEADGYILYTSDTCTKVVRNAALNNTQGVILYTNSSGVIASSGCAS